MPTSAIVRSVQRAATSSIAGSASRLSRIVAPPTSPGAGTKVGLAPTKVASSPSSRLAWACTEATPTPPTQLDDRVRARGPQRTEPVDHRQQGLAPRGHPDPLAAGQGGLEIAGAGGARAGQDRRPRPRRRRPPRPPAGRTSPPAPAPDRCARPGRRPPPCGRCRPRRPSSAAATPWPGRCAGWWRSRSAAGPVRGRGGRSWSSAAPGRRRKHGSGRQAGQPPPVSSRARRRILIRRPYGRDRNHAQLRAPVVHGERTARSGRRRARRSVRPIALPQRRRAGVGPGRPRPAPTPPARSATSTGRPSRSAWVCMTSGEAVSAAVGAQHGQRDGGVGVDHLDHVADLVGDGVDGGAGQSGRIGIGVEPGDHPADLAVPVRSAETGERRHQRDVTGVRRRCGQAQQRRHVGAEQPGRPGQRWHRRTGCCPRGRTAECR